MRFFSSKELYVLASLLGMDFLVGVEGSTYDSNRSGLKNLFEENYSVLESKGIIDYKIDGILYIDRDVRESIELLNMADIVYLVATDRTGKLVKDNYFRRKDICCCLSETQSGYSVEKLDDINTDLIIQRYGIKMRRDAFFTTEISLEDMKRIDELYRTFNGIEADMYLSDLIAEDKIRVLIRECLMLKNKVFVLKKYEKQGSLLELKEQQILRFVQNFILSFSLKGLDTISITVYKGD